MQMRPWTPPGLTGRKTWNPEQEADLDRLYALDQACFAPGVAYTREELRAFLAHPSAFSVLLEDAPASPETRGALLGFSIGRSMRSRGRALFHIITIDVSPQARRRGAGTVLMDWMRDRARAVRAQALRLEVAVDNTEALGFYKSLGFVEVGRIPGYYLGIIDALVLERSLGPPAPGSR